MDAVGGAELIILLTKGYVVCGLIFAVPFLLLGIQRVDPAAKDSTLPFKLMVLPGVTLFWPLMLTRLLRGKEKPTECNAHRRCGLTQIRKVSTHEAQP